MGKIKKSSQITKSYYTFLFILLLAQNLSLVNSINRGNCNSQCQSTNDASTSEKIVIPAYKEGISYYYEYETDTITQLWSSGSTTNGNGNGNEDSISKVNLKGFAIVTAITPCYFDLTFSQGKAITQLRGPNANGQKRQDIPASSLRFHYENGTVQEVCTSEEDPHWSANIKRGILSLLQITNEQQTADQNEDFKKSEIQNDVSGTCPVQIEKRGKVYYKVKDLNKCKKREAGPSFLNGVPYDSSSKSTTLDSKASCKQEIYSNVLQTSMCNEVNFVNPFSFKKDLFDSKIARNNNVPKITMKTQISLVSTRTDFKPVGQQSDFSLSSINFHFGQVDNDNDHDHDNSHDTAEEREGSQVENKTGINPGVSASSIFENILETLCSDFDLEDVSKDAPEHYLKLKEALHRYSLEELKSSYEKITTNVLCPSQRRKLERIFLKTMAKAASPSAIGLLSELLIAGDLDDEISSEFLKNLAFAPKPRRKALTHLRELVQKTSEIIKGDSSRSNENPEPEPEPAPTPTAVPTDILLSTSAFAYQYCHITNSKCGSVGEYTRLVDTLAQYTMEQCDNVNENGAAVGLQALGNLQSLTPTAVTVINKCLLVKTSNRIRVHALNAFRRDPCQPLLKNKVKSMFTNARMGSDIRITAYLAIMKCLQNTDIESIQRALDNEQSDQVSSFIYSHITNQLESSSPGKQKEKNLLRKLHLDREFPKPMESFGRFSKNIELSTFHPVTSSSVELGVTAETNIVYSQDSYIPRTASFNLTMDMLGRSYNFIEVGVYLESFENLLNRFNAPLFSLPSTSSSSSSSKTSEDYADYFAKYDFDSMGLSTDMENIQNSNDNDNEILKSLQATQVDIDTESEPEPEQENPRPLSRKQYIDPSELSTLKNEVTTIPNRYRDDGACDTFLRLFGTTISAKSYQQKYLPKFYDIQWISDKYDEIIESFKDVIIERTKPLSLLEEHIIVAGTNGLPLNFMMDVSSILSSNYSLNIDFPAIFSNTKEGKEMSIKVIPNMSSLLRTRISVGPTTDSAAFQAGFQFEGKIHLSAAADFSLEKKVNSLRINYHFPLEKFRVFELETKLVWIEIMGMGGLDHIIQRKMELGPKIIFRNPNNNNSNGTGMGTGTHGDSDTNFSQCTTEDSLSSISAFLPSFLQLPSPHQFGLKYCYAMTIPREISRKPFWLQGPFILKISSEKLDPGMKGFSLDIKMNEKTTDESGLTITFDAPGSSTNRKVNIVTKFIDSTLPEIQLLVDYPSTNSPFNLIAKLHDSRNRKGISASLTRGNEDRQTATYYECALSVEANANGKEVIYEPICYSKSGLSSSSSENNNYAVGKVIRGLGKYLQIDLTLTSPITDNQLEVKGLILANRSADGNFRFTLENGEFAYNTDRNDDHNNAVITTHRESSLYFLVNGHLQRSRPSLALDLDLRYGYGTGKKETDNDLKVLSKVSYLPSQLFSLETTATSESSSALNTDFKISTEFVDESKTGTGNGTGTVLTFISSMKGPYYFDIHAVRKGGANSGSLNMTVDLPTLKRKLALYTNRHHEDLEQFIKFDFESFLKWHVDVDDSQTLAYKFSFQKDDSQQHSSFIQSTNQVVFIDKKYQAVLDGKIPKNLTNGEYLINLTYISPRNSTYSLSYKNVIAKDDHSNMASELELQVKLPSLDPISINWKKSFYAIEGQHYNVRALNNLSILTGEEKVFYFHISGTLVNNERGKFLQNELEVSGYIIPVAIKIQHDISLRENYGIESDLTLQVGEDQGKFVFHLTPRVTDEEEGGKYYQVQINWNPEPAEGESRFILDPVDILADLGGHLTSFPRNFKVQNRGFFKVGSSISIKWINLLAINPSGIDTELTLNLPLISASTSLKLKAGLENFQIQNSNSNNNNNRKKVAVLHLSSNIPDTLDFSTDLKIDPESPLNFLKISLDLPPFAKLSLNHEHAVESQNPNQNQNHNYVTIVSAVFMRHTFFDFSNRFQDSPTTKQLDSHLRLARENEASAPIPIINRNLSLTLEKSENRGSEPTKWNFQVAQTLENDRTALKAFGTIVLAPSSFQGTFETPKFYGRAGSLEIQSDFNNSIKTLLLTGKFNDDPSAGDSDVQLIDFFLDTHETEVQKGDSLTQSTKYEGRLSLPILSYMDDLNIHQKLQLRSPPEVKFKILRSSTTEEDEDGNGDGDELAEDDRRKISSELLVELENAAKIHKDSTASWKFGVKNVYINQERHIFSTMECIETQENKCSDVSFSHQEISMSDTNNDEGTRQFFKILSIHTIQENPNNGRAINISSGVLWNNQHNLDRESRNSRTPQTKSKSLCFVSQKVTKLDEEFKTCTLGFTSHAQKINGNDNDKDGKSVTDIKFALLDKIAFQGVKVEESDSVSFNSSFWLDSINKADEELRLSVTRKTIHPNSSPTADAGNQYFFGVQHPFLPRDLQVRTAIHHESGSPNYNGVAELDIFEKEDDKITIIAKYTAQGESFQDEFFGDFNDDYQVSTSPSSSSPGKFEASIQSNGLPIGLNVESSLDSSGISYSFVDRDGALRPGKFVLRIPSLIDSNVFQAGGKPMISISFDGVPRVHINGMASNESLILEYHGSPHSSLRIYGKTVHEEEEAVDDYEENHHQDNEVKKYYSLSLPVKSEESPESEFTFLIQNHEPEVTTQVLNLDISLNTSKLLRIETKWEAYEIKNALAELRKLQRAISRELKSTIIVSSKDTWANVEAWGKTVFRALPSIRPLLNKLEKEFQEDLEAIQQDPHSNVIYEFVSSSMLKLYHRTKSLTLQTSGVLEKAAVELYSFLERNILSLNDAESDFNQRLSSIQDEILGAFVLTVSRVKLLVQEARIKFQQYLENNPEFEKMVQISKNILSSTKILLQKVTRKILQKTIAIRPYLRLILPKEAHEFLIVLKNYSLDKLQLDDKGGIQTSEATNVTSDIVLAKAYSALTKMSMNVLERKGFLFKLENESAIVQFPLPKPVRTIRQAFSKTELVRPTYTQGATEFYQWITEGNNHGYDSRTPRISAIFSRLQNSLFGGVGPSDAVSVIINGQYFRTFDGKFHRFDSSCQYLLAADFLTGNISLAIEGQTSSPSTALNSKLIVTYEDEDLVIHPNATVEYGGEPIEIRKTESFEEFVAKNIGSFKAYRYDNVLGEVTEVTKDHTGVDIACIDMSGYSLCSIRLKNYLYGRSLGLLGSNNLESFDDFSIQNGEVVGKTSKFYRSWRINKECRETRGTQPSRDVQPIIKEKCAQMFSSNQSPMRACFPVIFPGDFQEVCENLASEAQDEENVTKSVCTVAASYFISCTEQYVKIDYNCPT